MMHSPRRSTALFILLTASLGLAFGPASAEESEALPQVPSSEGATTTTPTPPSTLIRFAAIVQYLSGSFERIGTSQAGRAPLEFKSILFEDERFATTTGTSLKLKTRNDCTAVLYGAAQLTSPAGEKPWRVKSDSVRWICPAQSREVVNIRGAVFQLSAGGELFLEGKKLLILSGDVSVLNTSSGPNGTHLPVGKILTLVDRQWQAQKTDQKKDESNAEAFNFNTLRPAPLESRALERPAPAPPPLSPPRENKVRLIVSPLFGRGGVRFDVNDLNQSGLKVEGARFQTQLKRKTGSLIFAFSFRDYDDNSENVEPGTTPPNGSYTRTSIVTLEAGYRLWHDKWWSPYFRVGGGVEKPRVSISNYQANDSYGSEAEYEFYSLTTAVGVDAVYSPSWLNWFGVYGGVEADLGRSLGRGARSVYRENCGGSFQICKKPAIANEPWSLTTYSLQLMLGVFAQF